MNRAKVNTTQKGKEPLRVAVKRLDEQLGHQLEEVWRLAEEGIHDAQRSRDGHQQGTPHCRAVEENLAALIPDDWKGDPFTAIHLFALSAAAALHDVGKASDSPNDHGHISMWELRDRAPDFRLDQGQAEIVGWIVRAHNDGDLEALPVVPVLWGVAEVNVRHLAALFKLADAFHADYRRVSRQVVELNGKRAEDNPKTHFRLCVRGWRFDDQGQIELQAVPKDWDDVAVIHTGFEMTRRELESVIPTLRDAGFPWKLTLRLDDTDLEHKAEQEIENERRIERAFLGMDYFTEADASHFKGRNDDAQTLWRRVMAVPVTLLVGDSGVGKTSLIHAGLFPLLHQARWRTAYTRPFDDPDHFITCDLWRDLLVREAPLGVTIVQTLERVSKEMGAASKLLVVLDQFEDIARTPLPQTLEELRKALVAVQAKRFRNLRLLVSYRADAEATIGPLFQEVAGSDRGLPRVYLHPLDHAGARLALKAGFVEAQVAVDDLLLDTITDELEVQTPTSGVYPPYVQMVGETLCRVAREESESILTEDLYQAKRGCENIIGRYLLRRLAEFGEHEKAARCILVALVRSSGVKDRQALEELQTQTGLDIELLTLLLARLADSRMIRPLGAGQYEIVHDHLALLVDQEIVDAEERQLKELREILALRGNAYAINHVLLQPPDMARLYAVRERISPNDDQMRLLLHSCLLERGPAWFWLRDIQQARLASFLRDALASLIHSLRQNAVSLMVQVVGREAIPDLRVMLKDANEGVRRAAAHALAQVVGREDIPDLRALLKSVDEYVLMVMSRALIREAEQEDIPDLRALLEDADVDVRWVATLALVQVTGREAIPDLRAMLEDTSRDVRQAAVDTLALVAGREAIPDLRAMLKDADRRVGDAAAQALVQLVGREDIPDLQAMLKDGDMMVRRGAAQALARVAGREAISDLRAMLKDANRNVRQVAAQALVEAAGREAIPDLREMLKDTSKGVRQVAAQALVEAAGREAIPDLRAMLKDISKDVRQAATEALVQVAGREAIPDLRAMLKDGNAEVRRVVAQALAQVAGREAIPNLRAMLKDADRRVGEVAAQALVQVVGREDIPDLQAMLKDGDMMVRRGAAQALARAAGREAIPDLQAILKDADEQVRQAAVDTLAQVAGREAIPDLREMLKDANGGVRRKAAQALSKLVTEDDLDWLVQWVVHYPLAETGELANSILVHLDRELYSLS